MKKEYLKNFIKGFCLNMLPEGILLPIKKLHYVGILRGISEEEERDDLKVIKSIVADGDYVIDVGANIGVYTKFFSEWVGISGRVYSIEPIPLTCKILRYNVKKLSLENVEILNCAISNANGVVTLEIPSYKSGGRNFYQAKIIDENREKINAENNFKLFMKVKVNSRTLDTLCSEIKNKISFIKCDIEGHEINCIKGAKTLIRNSKPAWLIEISGDPDKLKSPAQQLFHLLNHEGYEAYWYDGAVLNRRKVGDRSINYFFLTSKHLEILNKRSPQLLDGMRASV